MKGYIFDMDGTVIDSTKCDFEAWEKAFKDYNIVFNYKNYQEVLGAKGEEIVKLYIDISEEEVKEFLNKKEKYFKENVSKYGLSPVKGVEKILKRIRKKKLPLALATGSGKEKLDFIFNKVPLKDYFDVILTADDTREGKPNPEIFINAAKKLRIERQNAIVFEDAKNGVEAAMKAGMRCVAITTTHGKESLKEADLIIEDYEELDVDALLHKVPILKTKLSSMNKKKNIKKLLEYFKWNPFILGVLFGFISTYVNLKKNLSKRNQIKEGDKYADSPFKKGLDDDPIHSSSHHTGG